MAFDQLGGAHVECIGAVRVVLSRRFVVVKVELC